MGTEEQCNVPDLVNKEYSHSRNGQIIAVSKEKYRISDAVAHGDECLNARKLSINGASIWKAEPIQIKVFFFNLKISLIFRPH